MRKKDKNWENMFFAVAKQTIGGRGRSGDAKGSPKRGVDEHTHYNILLPVKKKGQPGKEKRKRPVLGADLNKQHDM